MPADSLLEQKETLRRLAEALGIAPTAFFGASDCDLSQAIELLRLWQDITDEQDRVKVLSLLRSLSGNMQASGEAVVLAHAMQKPE